LRTSDGRPRAGDHGSRRRPQRPDGEFKTYVADFFDGRPSDRYHTLRQATGEELRLDFDTEPSIVNGSKIWIRGESGANKRIHVSAFDLGPVAGRAHERARG